jgi:hypothetical protein
MDWSIGGLFLSISGRDKPAGIPSVPAKIPEVRKSPDFVRNPGIFGKLCNKWDYRLLASS